MSKWIAREDEFSFWVIDENGSTVADVRSPVDLDFDPKGLDTDERIEAAMKQHRARTSLLAAAPEMLEALKRIRNRADFDASAGGNAAADIARTVVAKVEGK